MSISMETGEHRYYAEVAYRSGDAFLFGPETRGLPGEVRERIGRENSLYIPMRAGSRSLNLSNAVAVVVYAPWRQLGFQAPRA